jgi:tRNA threonylcarbamoyladenosine biosynthesis protein TsaE
MELLKLADLDAFAQRLLEEMVPASGASVLALSGELGAGKTSLTQALGRALWVAEKIPSPTFLIMRSYAVAHPRFSKLVHIDAYRVDDPHELDILGFADLLREQGTLIVIEWPERIETLIPRDATRLRMRQGERADERQVERL